MLEPYKGIYAMASWRGGFKFLGNKKNGNYFQLEWRSYHGLSESNPRHLYSILGNGKFLSGWSVSLPGTACYMPMTSEAAVAGDILRVVSGDQIWCMVKQNTVSRLKCRGVLGGVLFLNATTTDNPGFGPEII